MLDYVTKNWQIKITNLRFKHILSLRYRTITLKKISVQLRFSMTKKLKFQL